jgi:hypothetical protein
LILNDIVEMVRSEGGAAAEKRQPV